MKKLSCLVVDDEPLAQEVLEKYISSLSSLELLAKCNNAIEAISFLHENSVDLMFLDVRMPGLSGLDFLKSISNPPHVILTTAFSEYALESYEYSVIDYLLKPIPFDRFLKAVNKVFERYAETRFNEKETNPELDFIFLYSDKVKYKVDFKDILFFEAYGNFIKVHLKDKVIVVSDTMKSMLNQLPPKKFVRVHKSYIISLMKIDRIFGNQVWINSIKIPIGQYYKRELSELLD